jgi:hypothetical protein
MRFWTLGLLAVTAAVSGVLHFDRMSPMAMDLVEIETALGFPLPAVLGAITLLLWMFDRKSRPNSSRFASSKPTPKRTGTTGSTEAQRDAIAPTEDWFEHAKASAKSLNLPQGARILLDPSLPCPIVLILSQTPPERSKRAIQMMALWISSIPTPPRARVEFEHCPKSPSPRHHQVAGSLAEYIDRSQYRTSSDLDAVDIFFFHPSSCWTNF